MDKIVVIWKQPGLVPQLVRTNDAEVVDRIRDVQRLYPDAEVLIAYICGGQIEVDCARTVLAIDEAERQATGEME